MIVEIQLKHYQKYPSIVELISSEHKDSVSNSDPSGNQIHIRRGSKNTRYQNSYSKIISNVKDMYRIYTEDAPEEQMDFTDI